MLSSHETCRAATKIRYANGDLQTGQLDDHALWKSATLQICHALDRKHKTRVAKP